MTEITKVPPLPDGHRPETGPMQFGEDWPGVFIRGDNALNYAMTIRVILGRYRSDVTGATLENSILKGLADLLASCKA